MRVRFQLTTCSRFNDTALINIQNDSTHEMRIYVMYCDTIEIYLFGDTFFLGGVFVVFIVFFVVVFVVFVVYCLIVLGAFVQPI